MDGIGIMRDPGTGDPVRMRVGVHSGSVVAGVVGNKMPRWVPIKIYSIVDILLRNSFICAIFGWRWRLEKFSSAIAVGLFQTQANKEFEVLFEN